MNTLGGCTMLLATLAGLAACATPVADPVAAAQAKLHSPQNFSQERLDELRGDLSETFHNAALPMPQRVQAYDDLLETFDIGTPDDVVVKYLLPAPGGGFVLTNEEEGTDAGHHTMGLVAPDGASRYLSFYEDLEHGIGAKIFY